MSSNKNENNRVAVFLTFDFMNIVCTDFYEFTIYILELYNPKMNNKETMKKRMA